MTTDVSRLVAAFQRAADGCAFIDVARALVTAEARLLAQAPRRRRCEARELLAAMRERGGKVQRAAVLTGLE